jgi:hypothetical protein
MPDIGSCLPPINEATSPRMTVSGGTPVPPPNINTGVTTFGAATPQNYSV